MKRTLSKRLKKSVSAILAAAMSISLFTAIPVSADIGKTTYNYDGYSVDYNVTNEWDGAQTVELTVSNTGTDSILNWALKYDAEGEISNLWNADLYEQNGDEYVIKNVGWNFEIAPNQSVTYGYTLSGNDLTLPKNFEIYSKRVDKAEGYDVQYNITKSWDVGVEGNIVITNTSSAPIEAWTLSFDSNFTIDNLWNGRVIENNELSYTISNQMVTSAIQPNTSFTVGFTGTKAADIEALLNNFKLTEVVIGDGNSVIPTDPSAEETGITANATYIYESGNIIVSWNTNNPKGTFNILMSEDGNNFTSIGVVEDMYEYVYIPNSTFNKIYFKVKQTTEDNSIESNIAVVYSFNSDGEKFPYTLFAVSDKEGAITISSDNFCINGDVSTNGTVVSNNNIININGAKIEKANNDMLYVFDKIEALYFSDNNVDEYSNDYILNDMNININTPMNVMGKASMTGSININTAIKAYEDIELYGDVKNTNNCVIFSKYRDIIIDSTNVNLSGLIYAPFGNVQITAQNLNLNNVVIIADTITLNSPNINTNYGDKAAQLIGTASEPLDIPYDEWKYMKDENENDLPDFFEDINNWERLKDTDGDMLPDCIEQYVGSDKLLIDTDGDGLDDFYELFITHTDPTKTDSDNNGIDDSNEDFDKDGLTNYMEYTLSTQPLFSDTDEDGLSDGEEVNIYHTDPLKRDTDEDGLDDGDEILFGMDPLNPDSNGNSILDGNEKIEQTYVYDDISEDCAISQIIIDINTSGNVQKNISVKSVMNIDLMSTNVVGLIGEPFDIDCISDFNSAKITFKVDPNKLGTTDFENLIFLWHDEENHIYRELTTTYDYNNFSVSAEVEHFSKYMIVDKKMWYEAWKTDLYKSFSNAREGNDTILVIDCSGSMSYNDNIVNGTCGRMEAARGFINVAGENDYIAIIAEDSKPKLLCDFTKDRNQLMSAVSQIYSSGGNNFISSLTMAANMLNNHNNGNNKNIIFMSDGGDRINESVLGYIKSSNINVISIGYGTSSNDAILRRIASNEKNFYKAINAEELIEIYSTLGIMKAFDMTDSDGDGLADVFEIAGMRLENGRVIYTNPMEADSDKDNFLDGDEIVPQFKFLDGHGIPSEISYGTASIYFVMNSDPNKNDMQKDYGVVKYRGQYYSINIPGAYWNASWEIVSEEIHHDFEFHTEKLFVGELTNTQPDPLLPGKQRLDIPSIACGKDNPIGNGTKGWGLLGVFNDLLSGVSNLVEPVDIKLVYEKSGNMRRVTIYAGKGSVNNMYNQYADNIKRSAYMENYNTNTAVYISNNVAKLYEEYTGNKAGLFDVFDYVITVDSMHKNNVYSSYLWINNEGKLMEKAIIYPNDSVIFGERKYILNFIPFAQLDLNKCSTEACSKYQEMIKEYVDTIRLN